MTSSLEKTIGDLMQLKQCLRCQALFSDMESVGAWECRVHPGLHQAVDVLVYGTDLDTYSCCGVSPNARHRMYKGYAAARGCVPCDHTIRPGIPDPLLIPIERATVLFGQRLYAKDRPGITIDQESGNVRITRMKV